MVLLLELGMRTFVRKVVLIVHKCGVGFHSERSVGVLVVSLD